MSNMEVASDTKATLSMQATNNQTPPGSSTAVTSNDCCDKQNNIKEEIEANKSNEQKAMTEDNDASKGQNENENPKNDSSTLSTAFTISFDDESTASPKKLFGIRDSIRKFAPPKPNTIEKPRPKPESQDNSYMSIESAPGGYSKQFFNRSSANNTSSRSSGRKSDSSRHSNISESAAFLIDKMLNCKQGESLSSIYLENERQDKARTKSGTTPKKQTTRSSDDILDGDVEDEVDFCDDKSDNGTYIVGAEPESDAARKKIDELFGVFKTAEASIRAASNEKHSPRGPATVMRQSRLSEKKPLNRERQEHINRLATIKNTSRSSSSSGREVNSASQRPRSVTRQSRNSSCDRASKLPSSRPRRATSQSSRQSSNRGQSDGDTQSSRSSLHADMIENPDLQAVNHPSMKFNRAFALRRARLGLGEPIPKGRLTSTPTGVQETENANVSPRRAINAPASKYGSSSQQGFSRNDGGRYSLRMKNVPITNRLAGLQSGGRAAGQQSAFIDNYSNKVYGSKTRPTITNQISPIHQSSHHASNTVPYQSSDELEISSSSRFKNTNLRYNDTRQPRSSYNSEIEPDADYSTGRFNYSLGAEQELYNTGEVGAIKANSSSGQRVINTSSQLGALDCLVISAISGLSVKIRGSVCDLMVDYAKKLPPGNETRSIVEEILPQLAASSARSKSPTSIEEIDQSLYFELAQTLKNLKKTEQMVDVMKLISNQSQSNSGSNSNTNSNSSKSPGHRPQQAPSSAVQKLGEEGGSKTNSETNSLSPV